MSNIITITGPSQSGKSTSIDYLLKNSNDWFKPYVVPKFTTRPIRSDDKKLEITHCTEIPPQCDIIYEQYGYRYGLSKEDIITQLKKGNTVIVILNDVRTIYELKRIFGETCFAVFIFRTAPKLDQFRKISQARGVHDEEDVLKRYMKANAIYRIYIENIALFDSVIINSFDFTELQTQLKNIINFFKHKGYNNLI